VQNGYSDEAGQTVKKMTALPDGGRYFGDGAPMHFL
jgi:hypothetical protein